MALDQRLLVVEPLELPMGLDQLRNGGGGSERRSRISAVDR
jgi:hypothetical protein